MAANDGGVGRWGGDGMGPVHEAAEALVSAMAGAAVASVSVALRHDGVATVRVEYQLHPSEACEVCGEPLPHEPPAPVQAAAGMVH